MARLIGNAIASICRLLMFIFNSLFISSASIKSAKLTYFAPQILPVNTVFNLQPNNINTSQSRLFIIIGLHGISYTVLSDDNTFSGVGFFTYDTGTSIKKVATAADKIIASQALLTKQFSNTTIIYTFTNSVLVPYELFNNDINKEMLELLYGNTQEEIIKTEFVQSQNLYNIYRVPADVVSLLAGRFPSATYTHLHSILPDVLKEKEGDHIYGLFGANHITVMLKKKGELQLIQKFEYKTPEDVAYHLLKVCNSFDASVDETTLYVNGLLDKVSTLYAEIYKFFRQIQFATLPEGYTYTDEIKKHPSHFFSHLFALASCV